VGGGGARPLPTAARREDSMLQTGILASAKEILGEAKINTRMCSLEYLFLQPGIFQVFYWIFA
jgi:hypothetical protein